MKFRRLLIPAALTAVAALTLSGCVDNSAPPATDASSGSSDVTKDEALAKMLPEDIASSGKLVLGMDNTYPPNEFKDDAGNPAGWEVELGEALAAKLGLKAEFAIAKFDNIIPSVVGGKYAAGLSSFTDTVEREEQVDFVNYYTAGIAWASQAGKDVDPENACGLKVGVQTGTYEATDEVPAKSQACVDAGKPAIEIFPYETQDAATNAVILGQIDAMSADSPVTAAAIAKSDGKMQAAGDVFDVAPYGMPVAKDSELTPVLQQAMQALIDDGVYGEILSAWGVESGAVTTVEINAASQG